MTNEDLHFALEGLALLGLTAVALKGRKAPEAPPQIQTLVSEPPPESPPLRAPLRAKHRVL